MRVRIPVQSGFWLAIGCTAIIVGFWVSLELAIAGLVAVLFVGLRAYIRWRRRRLWRIDRQLYGTLIRSALFPLILSLLLGILLVFAFAMIVITHATRAYAELWFTRSMTRAYTCTMTQAHAIRCGDCRLPVRPRYYWTYPGRWAVPPRLFREWMHDCPLPGMQPAGTPVLVMVETDPGRLTWSRLFRTDLEQVRRLLRIPFAHAWIFYPDISPGLTELTPNTCGRPQRVFRVYRPPASDEAAAPSTPECTYRSWALNNPSGSTGVWALSTVYTYAWTRPAVFWSMEFTVTDLIRATFKSRTATDAPVRFIGWAFIATMLITGTAMAGLLWNGVRIARRIGHAVQAIETGVDEIAHGNFPVEVAFRHADQLGHLARRIERMSYSLAYLFQEKVSKERLEREVDIARVVQQRLYPRKIPEWPGLDVAARLLPARRLAGDYYDFFVLPESLAIVIVDVAGKGLPASLLMANMHALLHFSHRILRNPEDISVMLRTVNEHLVEHTEPQQFATLFYVAFLQSSHRFLYACAGHPPALLYRQGTLQELHPTGPIIGALPEMSWETRLVHFPPGSILMLYTDGVVEAPRAGDGTEYGRERLKTRLQEWCMHNRSAAAILECLLKDLYAWVGHTEFPDDVSVIVLRNQEDTPAPMRA